MWNTKQLSVVLTISPQFRSKTVCTWLCLLGSLTWIFSMYYLSHLLWMCGAFYWLYCAVWGSVEGGVGLELILADTRRSETCMHCSPTLPSVQNDTDNCADSCRTSARKSWQKSCIAWYSFQQFPEAFVDDEGVTKFPFLYTGKLTWLTWQTDFCYRRLVRGRRLSVMRGRQVRNY